MRPLRLGAVAVLALGLGGVAFGVWSGRPVSYTPVSLPNLQAEVLYLNASSIVRRGPPRVIVVRFDGDVAFVPFSYTREGLAKPLTIGGWADHLKAPVVFNAGQFDENLRHLGWLKAKGEWIVSQRKQKWLGLLLSGPRDEGVWARIADLQLADPSVVERYDHALQSMMLVDHDANVRVRESDRTACRTVVAEDTAGRIMVMVTEGAMTLADLARWLPQAGLDIVRAMNLDGGVESQLSIRTEAFSLEHYGQYGTGTTVFDGGPGPLRFPLPSVVAVTPTAPAP